METKEPNDLADVLHYLWNIVLTDLCIFAAVALVCWLMNALTVNTYATLLEVVGGVALMAGAMDFMGGLRGVGVFRYPYGSGSIPIDERAIQDMGERKKSYRFTFLMAFIALGPIAFGVFLQMAFP